MILPREFYERDPLVVAKALLGKVVVHEAAEGVTAGRIVETEAYVGPEDKASHAYGGLRTRRTEVQYGLKGHAYVYLIYGMYYCFNVTVGKVPGKPEAVLMRALEPIEGFELMAKRRPVAKGDVTKLTNGPGKLCSAMGISKKQNGADICALPFYIRNADPIAEKDILSAMRIGVDYADDWTHKPWRLFVRDCPCVSVGIK